MMYKDILELAAEQERQQQNSKYKKPVQSMDSWKKYNDKHWSTGWFDQKTITFKGSGGQWKTAYGGIPMRCIGGKSGIHEFVLKIVNGRGIVIGIDDGRDNLECNFCDSSSHHYGLYSDGHFYGKGTY